LKERPAVTFALFAYNQERFIREAVAGAFAQTWSPLEIILSDDCSADGTFELMQEMADRYDGPHTVRLNRNPRNLGIGGHLNQVLGLVRGDFVVLAAGDDISLPTRTETLVNRWLTDPTGISCLYSALQWINEHGEPIETPVERRLDGEGDLESLVRFGHSFRGASQAWPRSLFERFGPFLDQLVHEDLAITLRARLTGRIEYVDEALVQWRVGTSTWVVPGTSATHLETTRKRAAFGARTALVNALQALADIEKARRTDLLQAATTRLREAELALRIVDGGYPSITDLIGCFLDRMDLVGLLKLALKMRGGPLATLATHANDYLKLQLHRASGTRSTKP
jgi:cellulose synthase/poly-beta-1,6-N-acetylglucosamine synthase-like glycosyltransferase